MVLVLYLAFTGTYDVLSLGDSYYPVVLLFAVHFGLALWVYYDAKQRDFEEPMTWYLAVALPAIGLFGVFAYLSRRKRTPEK